MIGQPFRLEPAMPPGAYKTYGFSQPKTAHTRIATCQQAGCEAYERGWQTIVPAVGPQAAYIRSKSGRRFTEAVVNGVATFTFYPGQQCFAQHHVQDRPQFYRIRGGDWRANPTGMSTAVSGQAWVDDFGENQERIKEQIERG